MNIISSSVTKPIAELILAHGAGAGCNSEFMLDMTALLTAQSIRVHRFNFSYMQRIEDENRRRPPSKITVLEDEFLSVIEQVSHQQQAPIWLGGKSMGGRVASMIVQQSAAVGAICLGYPFHPPGKPDKLRVAHLPDLMKPCLIVQGERDTFGNASEILGYDLPSSITVECLTDGDHSLKPRKSSGITHAQHLQYGATLIKDFIRSNVK